MKTICKVLALILIAVLAFSMISCGETHFSEEFVLEEFDDIVRKIKDHKHVHAALVVPGMTEEEFDSVEHVIHVAIHDGDYTIVHNGTEDFIDDDNMHVYLVRYSVKSGENVVDVVVTYCDGHDTLYCIELAE